MIDKHYKGTASRRPRVRKAAVVLVLAAWMELLGLAEGRCPNLCSGHGTCDVYLRCSCFEGWQGADCSERTCPFDKAWADEATATNTAHNLAECSNRGTCDRETGLCSCMEGFTGKACQRTACANDCNHHGKCVSMNEYAKEYKSSEDSRQFDYSAVWDAKKLYGCVCDEGYEGYDCSLKSCPRGDDPLTKGQLNEVQLVKCVASGGNFVLYHHGNPSATMSYKASAYDVEKALEAIEGVADVAVAFTSGTRACTPSGANIIKVEFRSNFGPQPPLTAYTESLTAGGYVQVAAEPGTALVDDRRKSYKPVKGTKENDVCSNRGLCDHSEGSCLCFDTNGDTFGSSDGYGKPGTRGDCGYAMTTVAHCPGEVACSGHGKCNSADKSYRCDCAEGWRGGDCSERLCPSGTSWFSYPLGDNHAHDSLAECSDRGICDRTTGDCTCDDGFFGAACEYMACGGGATTPCNDHGRCLSMTELAEIANFNGDATAYTYGLDPNNHYTWDGSKVYGCHCDPDFQGYDCSQRVCPRGDDPGTYGQSSELQVLQCTASSGDFTLAFRQHETAPLAWNATAAQVSAAFNALPSVKGGAELAFSSATDSACNAAGSNYVSITFFAVFGNVPAVQVNTSYLVDDNNGGELGSGTVSLATDGQVLGTITSVQGTTENEVCSNRGLCDTATGVCNCFLGFSSSNGQGGEGSLGECGYRVPKRASYTSTTYT